MSNKSQSGGVYMEQAEDDLLLVEAYGDGGFRMKGSRLEGSLYITADGFYPVACKTVADLTEADFDQMLSDDAKPEILLVGTGAKMQLLPVAIKKFLVEAGHVPDIMDTGAAARTFNVLRMEGRQVAALLLQVD
ncbi:MAG: Mth938-like domain-containing protein [Kordiimonadaceae bacterium]|nr:Mth938-like domain-containing protein [Kordiimonadaceae bacterium]